MDEKLYANLAAATKYYLIQDEFYSKINNERKFIQHLEQNSKNKRYALSGIFFVFFILSMLSFLIPTITVLSELHHLIETNMLIFFRNDINNYIHIIVACIFLPITIIICIVWHILSKKLKNKYISVIQPQINESISNIELLINNLEEFEKQNIHVFDFLPTTYHNIQAISYMLLAVSNGRADTLKEAMNLYEEQLHRWKLEAYARQSAETQEYCARAMDELNSKQTQTNEHLRSIEFMQYANYTKN